MWQNIHYFEGCSAKSCQLDIGPLCEKVADPCFKELLSTNLCKCALRSAGSVLQNVMSACITSTLIARKFFTTVLREGLHNCLRVKIISFPSEHF